MLYNVSTIFNHKLDVDTVLAIKRKNNLDCSWTGAKSHAKMHTGLFLESSMVCNFDDVY